MTGAAVHRWGGRGLPIRLTIEPGAAPGRLPALLRMTGSDAARSASVVATRQAGVVHAPANQPGGTFDWAAASIGAGVTVGIGLLILGATTRFGRRRVRGQLPAS